MRKKSEQFKRMIAMKPCPLCKLVLQRAQTIFGKSFPLLFLIVLTLIGCKPEQSNPPSQTNATLGEPMTVAETIESLETFNPFFGTSVTIGNEATKNSVTMLLKGTIKELKKKAENGDAQAQLALKQNNDRLRKAADQGNAIAQYFLGVSYKNGNGVEKDYVEAYAWWNIAAISEPTIAKRCDDLEKEMTPDQIAAGENRAKELKAKIPVRTGRLTKEYSMKYFTMERPISY